MLYQLRQIRFIVGYGGLSGVESCHIQQIVDLLQESACVPLSQLKSVRYLFRQPHQQEVFNGTQNQG
jgi:hypothetical protein